MKYHFILLALLLSALILNIVETRRSKTHSHLKHKMLSKKKQFYYSYPSGYIAPYYYNSPTPNLYTPLTSDLVSRGGNIYATNANAIPYGTGYSYGGWSKIR